MRKFNSSGTFIANLGIGILSGPRSIAVSGDGYLYVADYNNNRIVKLDANGILVSQLSLSYPLGVAVGPDGTVYATSLGYNNVFYFNSSGTAVPFIYFNNPYGIAVSPDGYIFITVLNTNSVSKFDNLGNNLYDYTGLTTPYAVAVPGDGYLYPVAGNNIAKIKINDGNWSFSFSVAGARGAGFNNYYLYGASYTNNYIRIFTRYYTNWVVQLAQVDDIVYNSTSGSQTSRIRYLYDNNGNIVTEYHDEDISTANDDSTIWRVFYPDAGANLIDKPARERTYSTIMTQDSGGANLKAETDYYYDGNNTSQTVSPVLGNLTCRQQYKDAANSISTYYTYESYGNKITETDPDGNVTSWNYAGDTYHTNPMSRTYPAVAGGQFIESYTYEIGTSQIKTLTDINGQITAYTFDPLDRVTSVDKPGGRNPDITYDYLNWGVLNQQRIVTRTYYDATSYLWQKEYFDGLGRIIQVQSSAEPASTHVIVSSTAAYNVVGSVDKRYVSQDLTANPDITYYVTPDAGWKYTTYTYDGLGRTVTQANPDGTSTSNNYDTAWQNLVTNERGYSKRYYYDAFRRLTKVEELNDSQQVYAATNYNYDIWATSPMSTIIAIIIPR